MRKAFLIVSNSALLIASVIGGGLATGREVMLYFGELSPLSAFGGGFCTGLLILFFMLKPRSNRFFERVSRFIETIGASFIIVAMSCALNTAFPTNGCPVAELSVLLCVFINLFPIEFLSFANIPIVLTILCLIIPQFFGSHFTFSAYDNSLLVPVSYSAMNILLTASITDKLADKLSVKQKIYISLIVSVVLGATVMMIYFCSLPYKSDPLPMYSAAKNFGYTKIYSVILYLSVFSTMLSASKILFDNLIAITDRCYHIVIQTKNERISARFINLLSDRLPHPEILSALLCVFVGVCFHGLSFEKTVSALYPIIGAFGYIKLITGIITCVLTR